MMKRKLSQREPETVVAKKYGMEPSANKHISRLMTKRMGRAEVAWAQPSNTAEPAADSAQSGERGKGAEAAVLSQSSMDVVEAIALVKAQRGLGGDDPSTAQADTSGVAALTRLVQRAISQGSPLLRMKQLVERTKLSRATLYCLMGADPTFPRKIKLTVRSIGFLEYEVDAWIASRAALRDATQ
jgi:predicted DNA-binding transcriptional regulator AlpA